MRIGIWCDYGFTLEPSEGIGVFVDNLARGLVKADPSVTVTMMAHFGQEAKLDSVVAAGSGRIHVVAASRKLPKPRRMAVRWLRKFRKLIGGGQDARPTPNKAVAQIDRWIVQLGALAEKRVERLAAQCDVWLLPYVGLDREFNQPTVVTIHDLVCYHYPEMLSPEALNALKLVVNNISNKATVATCMSHFIRDNDLYGELNLPASRVRVIKPAVPDDLNIDHVETTNRQSTMMVDDLISPKDQILFYPSAFRTYKNHACLIDALHILRARDAAAKRSRHWKVVFTGIRECPSYLQTQIERLGLCESVVALGKVSRQELDTLYRLAFATVVPSLYEQGSFPVMEALHCGCPVAASNIPSLVEQFSSMGESMLFFDPHDAIALANVIEQIARERQSVIERQRQGFVAMRCRTWEEAAREWLEVFREAIAMNSTIEDVRKAKQCDGNTKRLVA